MKKGLSPTGRLYATFIIGTATILLVALGVANTLEFLLTYFNVINRGYSAILILTMTSIVIGVAFAFILGKIILKPIATITDGMKKLSDGDFTTRIDLGKYAGMKNLANDFNTLAVELEKTEILRSDFINDFSHELKTPIVSISGLIPLLRSDRLPEEKKLQYLSIMETEANRLTQMTSNALYLSKIESQAILTNKTKFNLSEQIRNAALLLERKWTKKNVIPILEFDEFEINANEDMLMQVWVNILDNAIKFAEAGTEIGVNIKKNENFDSVSVCIRNYGPEIPKDEIKAIFNKFYQCDKSRSTEGNGIGLSIVRHIVSLHNGSITVSSAEGITAFTVTLPC